MLKSSISKSAESRKGVVGVGGSGKNRAKPVSKYEVDSASGKSVKKLSKSRHKVEVSSKSAKASKIWKICKSQ